MIESFTFVNAADGFALTLNDLEIPLSNFDTSVDWRNSDDLKFQADGMWANKTYLGKRMFTIQGDILQQDSVGYMNKRFSVYRALRPSPQLGNKVVGQLQIQFTGISEILVADCAVESVDMPMEALSPSRGKLMIAWRSGDPRMYGSSLRTASSTLGTTTTTGRTFKKIFPKSYNLSSSSPADAIVTNAGNATTFLKARLYGEVLSPSLVLTRQNGSKATWALNGYYIRPGTYVDVDFRNNTAVASDGTNVYSYTEGSEWFQLEPGSNQIKYSAVSNVGGPKADLSWYNAYLV